MAQSKLIPLQQRQSYGRLIILIFLVLFAGKFVVLDAIPYFSLNKEIFGQYKYAIIGGLFLSDIKINMAKDKAVLYLYWHYYELGKTGFGRLVFLNRTKGGWKIHRYQGLWQE